MNNFLFLNIIVFVSFAAKKVYSMECKEWSEWEEFAGFEYKVSSHVRNVLTGRFSFAVQANCRTNNLLTYDKA